MIDRLLRSAPQSSLLWGGVVTAIFYLGLGQVQDQVSPLVLRFVTGHWEAQVCVAVFFVAAASLVIRMTGLVRQMVLLKQPIFGNAAVAASAGGMAGTLLKQLESQPAAAKNTYLHRRLSNALQFAQRQGAEVPIDEHLRQLADSDAASIPAGYAMVRFMSGAIAAVGSLGTVFGIAKAVAQLSAQAPTEPLTGVTEGLALAFDTTALALMLTIVLMSLKFLCEQQETLLLGEVERRAGQELLGKLANPATPRSNSSPDQFKKLAERLAQVTEQLAQNQANLAPLTSERAAAQPAGPALESGQLEAAVNNAISKAFQGHSPATGQMMMADGSPADWMQIQQALRQIADFFLQQQEKQTKESATTAVLAAAVQEEAAAAEPRPIKTGAVPRPKGSRPEAFSDLFPSMRD